MTLILCLDRGHINPEASVIRLILRIGVDLLLDPLDRLLIEVNIACVGIVEARSAVAMAGEPLIVTIIVLTVPSSGDVGVDIIARESNR